MAEHINMTVTLSKQTEEPDGSFTPHGMLVLGNYARMWIAGARDLLVEGEYPELGGTFYDIRIDGELAQRHALPDGIEIDVPVTVTVNPGIVTVNPDPDLEKALDVAFSSKKKKKTPVTFIVSTPQ